MGNTEGYFDFYNTNHTTLKANANIVARRRKGAHAEGDNFRYEFVMSPCNGFLQNLEPLLKDCELKIRLERTQWNVAVEAVSDAPAIMDYIEIKDVYAISEYISSPKWRNYFDKIDGSPIMYNFQEYEAIVKCLPQNETEIRLDTTKELLQPDSTTKTIVIETHHKVTTTQLEPQTIDFQQRHVKKK